MDRQFERVLGALQGVADERRRRAERIAQFYGLCAACCVIAAAAVIAMQVALRHSPRVPLSALSIVCTLLLIAAAAVVQRMKDACLPCTQEERGATMALLRHEDPRAVGILCEELAHLDFTSVQPVQRALARLLPRLTERDAHLLSPEQLRRLYVALETASSPMSSAFNVEFVLATLDALQRVGDEGSLGIVRRLAAAHGRGPGEERIRAAAATCLPLLESRIERAKTADPLLRAADDPAQLLHPIVASAVLPEQLVRPRSSPDGRATD